MAEQYRIWWVPQVPMAAFHVTVEGPSIGRKLLDTLAAYDLFQLKHNVKPDFCNAGGLEVLEDGEWCEWEDGNGDDVWNAGRFRLVEQAA